jgi:hypothetical protein
MKEVGRIANDFYAVIWFYGDGGKDFAYLPNSQQQIFE